MAAKPDDLETLLCGRGGLDGPAGELGQHDPSAKLYELAANDNERRKRVGLWEQFLNGFPSFVECAN